MTAPFDTRPWLETPVPELAERVPTMLSDEEGRLLYSLARQHATGEGAVCDLGCFAGGSTARLAAGVADAGRNTPVHAFDHFNITDPQKERYLYPAGIAPFEGHDMRNAVAELLAPWPMVRLRPGDINKADWRDGPIEILFIDAAKSPSGADRIAATFFPHLIPGRSVIVQQDYLHWRQPWVPAQMELLAGCTEPVAWCRKGSVAFRVTAPVTPDRLTAARVAELDDARLLELLSAALSRCPDQPQRKRLAQAILGVRDNPGVRVPSRFRDNDLRQDRVHDLLRQAARPSDTGSV